MNDKTPIHGSVSCAVLDGEASPLDNFRAITQFINKMPVSDKSEMLMTLSAYCRAELNG